MIQTVFPVAVIFASLAAGLHPAMADEAPWCAVIAMTEDGVYWDCQYRSFEECRPHVLAGNRGWCNPSPYFTPGATEQKHPRKLRPRR